MKKHELGGRKFGILTVVGIAETEDIPKDIYRKDGSRWWVCACACGKVTVVNAKRLISGGRTSCGCTSGRTKPEGEAAKWQVYKMLAANAKRRGKLFALTLEQFLHLTGAPCSYCGVPWSSDWPSAKRFNGSYRHNGIDRINSEIGYVFENCTTACSACNYAKAQMTVEQFKAWVARVYKHLAVLE